MNWKDNHDWTFLKCNEGKVFHVYLFIGLDLSCDSFSKPILSFKPSFKSGIPERKHFMRIFPVTSQRSTLPKPMKWILKLISSKILVYGVFFLSYQQLWHIPLEDIRRLTLSTISKKTWKGKRISTPTIVQALHIKKLEIL